MPYQIDAIDKRILNLLQEDGKRRIRNIAETLGMSNTPVFDRIKRLEREGYIKGYIAVLDSALLGYGMVAFCSVTLERHHRTFIIQFVTEIQELPEVLECYHIAGSFDYLLKIVVKDMDAYQHFISDKLASLANIGRVQSSFVMTQVKHSRILSL